MFTIGTFVLTHFHDIQPVVCRNQLLKHALKKRMMAVRDLRALQDRIRARDR